MELVAAMKCLDHLPLLEVVKANCARIFVVVMTTSAAATLTRQLRVLMFFRLWGVFFLLVLEAWNWVYDVFYFLGRSNWIPVLINLLAVFVVVLVSVFLEVLLISVVHSWWTTHPTDIETSNVRPVYILRSSLPVVKHLLGLTIWLKLIPLGLLTSRLSLLST